MCSVAQRSGTVRPPRPRPGRPSPNAAPRTRGRRLCAAVGGGRPTRQPVPAAARRASPRAVPSRGRVGRGSRGLSAAASQPPDVPLLVGALSGAGGSGLVWSVLVFARCLVPRTVVPSLGRVCTEHKRGVQSTARALAPAGRSGGPRAGRGCPRARLSPGRGCPRARLSLSVFGRGRPAPRPRGGEMLRFRRDAAWGQLGIVTEIRYFYGELCGSIYLLIEMDVLV